MTPKIPIIAQPTLGRAHFRAADGAVLPIRSWLPPRSEPQAIVLALHGFNDYSNAFDQPGLQLSSKGVAVFAYDQRGFGNAPGRGRWAGNAAYETDAIAVVGQLRRRYPHVPLFLLGESMGGAVVMTAMTASAPNSVDGVILSAPAVWSRDMMPWYQRALLALVSTALPDMKLTGSGMQVRASDNMELLRGMGRDRLVIKETRVDAIEGLTDLMDMAQARAGALPIPALVLYGEHDQIIPAEPVVAMLEKMRARPTIRLAIYPEGYHLLLRDLHADQPLADIAAWVKNPRAQLPSGHERALGDRTWLDESRALGP